MELVLEKIIRSAAYRIAVSPDGSRLAISSERKVTILSLPDLKKENAIPVRHTSSMIFLEDNYSMLVLDTTGGFYLWNGEELENLGRRPVPRWVEGPLFYAGRNSAFWAGGGAVWKYDVEKRQMTKVFSTEREPFLCRVDDGIIRLVTLAYNQTLQHMEIFQIDHEGAVLSSCRTKELQTAVFGMPCWDENDRIAISTAASTAKGAASFVYVIDGKNGEVLSQTETQAEWETGDFYCGNGLLAKCNQVLKKKIRFFEAQSMNVLCDLQVERIEESGEVNPPTMVAFLPDGRILAGSWRRLFVFRLS